MRVAVATDPGSGGPNEDWAAVISDTVIVLDGQTARTDTGCVHGISWYTRQLGATLAYLLRDHARPLAEALAEGIGRVAEEHPGCELNHPGTPSAVVGIVRLAGESIEYAVLGDVSVVVEADALRVITDNRVSVATQAEREVAVALPDGSPERRRALVAMKHAEHAARNRPGGFWVAASDPTAAEHAVTGAVSGARRVAVTSDGASRAVRLFDLLTWPAALDLMAASGPWELISLVRAAEAIDPASIKWPRTKGADDATVAYVELGDRFAHSTDDARRGRSTAR